MGFYDFEGVCMKRNSGVWLTGISSGAGLLKPFNNAVNSLGTPQLNSIFSAPFSYGGKMISNEIKNLQNVDTTKTH